MWNYGWIALPPCSCTKQKKICSHSLHNNGLPEEKNLIVPIHQHGRHDVKRNPPILQGLQVDVLDRRNVLGSPPFWTSVNTGIPSLLRRNEKAVVHENFKEPTRPKAEKLARSPTRKNIGCCCKTFKHPKQFLGHPGYRILFGNSLKCDPQEVKEIYKVTLYQSIKQLQNKCKLRGVGILFIWWQN